MLDGVLAIKTIDWFPNVVSGDLHILRSSIKPQKSFPVPFDTSMNRAGTCSSFFSSFSSGIIGPICLTLLICVTDSVVYGA